MNLKLKLYELSTNYNELKIITDLKYQLTSSLYAIFRYYSKDDDDDDEEDDEFE